MPSYLNHRAKSGARSERRRFPRVRVLGELYGRVVAFDTPVEIRNIGPGGFSISGPLEFPVGAEHQFEVTSADGQAAVLQGRSAHASERITVDGEVTYLTGFSLTDDQPGGASAMHDLVVRLASQTAHVA